MPLPQNWTEVFDENSGSIYYYNSVTQESRWEPPASEEAELPEGGGDRSVAGAEGTLAATNELPAGDDSLSLDVEVEEETAETIAEEIDQAHDRHTPSSIHTEESVATESSATAADPAAGGHTADEPEPEEEIEENGAGSQHVVSSSSLPPGWIESTDSASGHVYYYNERTQATQWERPVDGEEAAEAERNEDDELAVADSGIHDVPVGETTEDGEFESDLVETSPGGGQPTSEEKPSLPPAWREATDPSSGSVFYHNVETNETSWDRPVAQSSDKENHSDSSVEIPAPNRSSETKPVVEPGQESQAVELETEVAQTTGSHVEEEDGVIVQPAQEDAQPLQSHQDSDAEVPTNPDLPENWVSVNDPASGKIYYYNSVTNETSWEPPKACNSSVPEANADEVGVEAEMARQDSGVLVNEAEDDEIDQIQEDWTEVDHPADVPDGVSGELPNEDLASDIPSSNEPLPDGWVETVDQSSGNTYYYNEVTEETSWDRPTVVADSDESGEVLIDEPAVISRRDDAVGVTAEGEPELAEGTIPLDDLRILQFYSFSSRDEVGRRRGVSGWSKGERSQASFWVDGGLRSVNWKSLLLQL